MSSFDVLIRNGWVIDGNSNPWFHADVGIRGKKIARVGSIDTARAERVIDARGRVVAPGFVDIHTHSEVPLLVSGRAESTVRQGVTTVLTCNCGTSPFPLLNEAMENAKRSYGDRFGLDVDWSTAEGYKERLLKRGTSINVGLQVGHGTVRAAVMGYEARPPSRAEMREMRRLVAEAMRAGVFGMSTGLEYPPGAYADTREVVELAKVVSRYGGIYSTDARGGKISQDVPGTLNEIFAVAEKARIPVQMSHIGSTTAKPLNWGRARSVTLNLVEAARARGVDFTADIYPYNAGSSDLSFDLPNWVFEGGIPKMLERLAKTEVREALKKEMAGVAGLDPSHRLHVHFKSERNKAFEGMTLKQIAEAKGVDPVDAMCDLLIDEGGQCPRVRFYGLEEDIRALMRHEAVMICSDGSALEPKGVLGRESIHPRSYGAFPRVLGAYVREGVFTLPEAVHKMTGMPAWRLGLRDRGVIRPGASADLTVFDPFTVKDRSTWKDPALFPEGISYVLVNGIVTVDGGEHTGAKAGEILLRPKG